MALEQTEEQGKESPAPSSSILVMGVGNILLSDEGVGVRVIEALKERKLPDTIELLDGGTGMLDLLDILANRDKVIIIDAVRGGNEPGAVYRFTLTDIAMQRQNLMSLHQIGLLETLNLAELTGCTPRDVVILGIEPKKIDWGLELSPEVAAVVSKVIELVISELGG